MRSHRLELIKSLLADHQVVMIDQLREALKVSDVTIRKDLDFLEKEKVIKKIRGGATLIHQSNAIGLTDYSCYVENIEEKRAISRLAVSLLDKQDSIFISSGSTCYIFASMIPKANPISILTNNVNVAIESATAQTNNILIGGEVYCDTYMYYTSGYKAIENLESFQVNRAFFSLDAIDPKFGLMSNFYGNTLIMKRLPTMCKETILLADHTKFGKIGIHTLMEPSKIDYIVTDREPPKDYVKMFHDNNVKMLICEETATKPD